MQLTYGGANIGNFNSSQFTLRRSMLRGTNGVGYGFDCAMDAVCTFTIDSQLDCTTKMAAIEAALSLEERDLKFLYDDGTPTVNTILNASSISGVRCVGYTWDNAPGGQFATWRQLSANFQWKELRDLGSLVDYGETVEFDNPPPQFVVLEGINDVDPEAYTTVPRPAKRGSQSGFAVGLGAYPTPNAAIFNTTPPLLKKKVKKKDPVREGTTGYWQYRIEWSYEYLSTTSLTADPNPWP